MDIKERGKEGKMERGLREKIGQCLVAFEGRRVYHVIRECREVFDSMGGAEGPRTDEAYRQLFGQEPPAAVVISPYDI